MSDKALDEARIKELMKLSFVELFQERKDLLYDLVAEIVEDIAMAQAIKEGEQTSPVSREEVFRSLG